MNTSMIFTFFQQNGYVLELSLAIFLFTHWMERRPRYGLRVGLCVGFLLLVSLLWQLIPWQGLWLSSLRCVLFFVLGVPCVRLCSAAEVNQAVFYVTAASAAQHMAYKAADLFELGLGMLGPLPVWLGGTVYTAAFVGCLWASAWFFGGRLRQGGGALPLTRSAVLPLLIGMQLTTNFFQNVFELYRPLLGRAGTLAFGSFDILSCLFLLFLQCEITKTLAAGRDNDILTQLLYEQKRRMEISRETVEQINIKCHDIKNQIAMLGSRIPSDEIEELNRAISIYDAAAKTGSEALDLLVVEKTLLCEKKQICFDCNADGAALDFLKPSDIYSLFGNAIDNAIEACSRVADPERRAVSVRVLREEALVSVRVENFYDGELSFADGLPQTSKADKSCHGFGVKSIRMIAEKYGGAVSIRAENGVFRLAVLLPAPEK